IMIRIPIMTPAAITIPGTVAEPTGTVIGKNETKVGLLYFILTHKSAKVLRIILFSRTSDRVFLITSEMIV
ncbi:MAG: hypothetical protein IJ006_08345, partial [Lachnospiraceae bacterium]|nr:hypothetical protein [Lachnospiraceae bacterium]